MKNLLLLLFVIAAFWKLWGGDDIVELGPGVKVTDAPEQRKIIKGDRFDFKGYQITPLADFIIKAKVLSKKNYSLGSESDLAPTDLALGWKNMSDEAVLNKIVITQSGRWYYWRANSLPIPRSQIISQSANMHLIPEDDYIESAIKQVKQGQIVEITGYLVRVSSKEGLRWQSSLSRDDSGAGGCEIIFVKRFNIMPQDN
jgi:hypothetical protein